MTTTLNLKKILHRPQAEQANLIPSINAGGSFVQSLRLPTYNIDSTYFAANSTSAIYSWNEAADTELTLPTVAPGGTFGAGTCGAVHPFGPTGTASAGTSTSLTTVLTIVSDLRGYRIRLTGGPGAGDERVISSVTTGPNAVVNVATAWSVTPTSSTTFQLLTPRLWMVIPSTALCYYDFALAAWTTGKSITGLTVTGTDGVLRATPACVGNQTDAADIGVWSNNAAGKIGTASAVFGSATTSVLTLASGRNWTVNQWAGAVVQIVSGTGAGQVRIISANTALTFTVSAVWSVTPDATSVWQITKGYASSGSLSVFSACTTSLLTVTTANWTVNQWANMQIRAVAGTGAGQVRTITSNTATTVTPSAVWTTAFDSTTIWIIEGCDDSMYFMGNNAVGVFRYSISGNAWTTAGATAARAAAPGVALSCEWVTGVNDAAWNTENTNKNGRYIFSFRGGGSTTLDQYDLSLGTWVSGLAYGNSGEVFSTGCSYVYDGLNFIYINQGVTGRVLLYDVLLNTLKPAAEFNITQGAATLGSKLFVVNYVDGPTAFPILYAWVNGTATLVRILMWYLY